MVRNFMQFFAAILITGVVGLSTVQGQQIPGEVTEHQPSAAFHWLDVKWGTAAKDVERIGARPTILSRQMAIPLTAMYDAWSAYDSIAVASTHGTQLRRPANERNVANKESAIAYAMYRTCLVQYPDFADYLTDEMRKAGYDPDNRSEDPSFPAGLGNLVARLVLESRHHDGANQFGDEPGCNGKPFSDYTMYRQVNPDDKIIDPDRWQRIPFDDGKGGSFTPGFLTPQWYRVRPFAIESADQFRPGPPPLVGSEQLKKEVDECIQFNANLTPQQKAIVEFMRDGPRSTGQSDHWLKFAQVVSRRDKNDLDRDVKLFFSVGNVAMDAFIAA